jgi:hypothetical protein
MYQNMDSKLSSFELPRIILAHIFGLQYTTRRKKAPESKEKSSLKEDLFMKISPNQRFLHVEVVRMLVLPIEIPQVQTSNLANHILLQAGNKKNMRAMSMHKKKLF